MTTLSFKNIKRIAFDALLGSPEIREWCLSRYGKPPAVVNDLDPLEPPCEDDCPVIGLTTIGGSTGQDESEYVRAFTVRVAIHDDTVLEERTPDGRLLKRDYAGSDAVTELLEDLLYPILCDAFNARNFPLSATEESVESMNMNIFQAKAELTVQMDKAIGERVPILG